MTRATTMGVALPGVELPYRCARSIYASAFETDDFQLRIRWPTSGTSFVYPRNLTRDGASTHYPVRRIRAVSNGCGRPFFSLNLSSAHRHSKRKGEGGKRVAAAMGRGRQSRSRHRDAAAASATRSRGSSVNQHRRHQAQQHNGIVGDPVHGLAGRPLCSRHKLMV